MHTRFLIVAPFLFATPALIGQDRPAPPPVTVGQPRAIAPAAQPGEQRVYGPTQDTLIAREAADGILEGFRKVYKTDGAPRIVVYVNRALVDTRAKSASDQASAPVAPTLADQQTVREVERLFGRAFRHAGASLADQKVAASLLPDQAGERILDQAAKEREALANIADVAIEVLISSRSLVVPQVSGDATYPVPDIQATAIRLKDSAIVGQASASDVLGKGAQAGRIVRQFDVADITEATALALMEDMLTGRK